MSATITPPAALESLDQWCVYNKGKRPRDHDDRDKLLSFTAARLEAPEDGGIGFKFNGHVQTKLGLYAVCLDLDACVNNEGQASPWAVEIVQHYGHSYTTRSPSGTGLHLWLLLREKPAKLPTIYLTEESPDGVDKRPQIQVFGCGSYQFVTFTGDHVEGTSREPVEDIDDLSWLTDRFKVTPRTEAKPTGEKFGIDLERASEVLQHVSDVDDREVWLRVGMGLHHEFGDDGFELWEEWGRQSDKNEPDDSRRVWDSFSGDGVGFATIMKMAKDNGFNPYVDADVFEEVEAPLTTTVQGRLLSLSALAERVGRVKFLVRGVLPHRGLGRLFGDPGSGKSTAAVSLALHVVGGESSWCDYEMPQGAGRVAYISGEGTPGLVARFQAGAKEFGVTEEQLKARLRVSSDSGSLSDPKDVAAWCADLDKFAQGSDLPLRLLVVDTQARNFGPGNEDKAEDMGRFLAGVQTLADRYRTLVIIVHHTGHQEKGRGRGSSAALGAMDVELRTAKRKGTSRVRVSFTKAKDFEEGPDFFGSLVGVPLSDDPADITAVFVHTVFSEDDEDVPEEFFGDDAFANAARVAAALADSPGLGARELRDKLRQGGSLASGAVGEALAALGPALVVVRVGRRKPHYLAGDRMSDQVLAHLLPEEREAVLAARAPDEYE